MTHAHPIPGLDALDSLAHRARHTAPDEPGATSVLAVILLQVIILIVAPYHPTGQVPPPCVTLFTFLDGDDFNLTTEFATILRDILIPLVDALPWPYPDDTDDEAGNEAEPGAERGAESKPGTEAKNRRRAPRATPTQVTRAGTSRIRSHAHLTVPHLTVPHLAVPHLAVPHLRGHPGLPQKTPCRHAPFRAP